MGTARLTGEQSKRVQILRGLACVAVVFIHNTPPGVAQVFAKPFLNFAVGLFLFLSGMLSSPGRDLKKRLFKLLIPYLLWTLIYSVMSNIREPAKIPLVTLRNLLFAKANGSLYYIFVYCELMLLIPLIDRLSRSRYRYWGFAIAPLEILIMRYLPLIGGYRIDPYIGLVKAVSCLGWFTYFYLGYLLGNGRISLKADSGRLILLWLCSLLLQMAEGFCFYRLGHSFAGSQLKVSSVLSGVLFALLSYGYVLRGQDRGGKLLKFLGDHSFGIYLSHLAVMAVLVQIPGYKTSVPFPVRALITVAITAVCVGSGKRILGKYSKYLGLS